MSVSGLHHLDLGSGANPDPDADVTVDLHHPDADQSFDVTDEWPLDDDSCHTITAHHLLEHIEDLEHVFQEAERCLVPGGRFVVTVPLGANARSDPDHVHHWTYETPEIVVGDYKPDRHWDPDTQLVLTDRTLHATNTGPLAFLNPLYHRLAKHYPLWASYNCDHGELQATYEVPTDE